MDSLRIGISTLVASMVFCSMAGADTTHERGRVMVIVHQFFNGLNKGDVKTAVAACASPASIIDDFPPHMWQGTSACLGWAKAFGASLKAGEITSPHVALGAPWHVDVSGDVAYVTMPATFTYKDHGKPRTEAGSTFTSVLKKTAAGWRITAWTWTKHQA